MTFEEDFPNIGDPEIDSYWGDLGYSWEQIARSTIDKQRVKEAFEKLLCIKYEDQYSMHYAITQACKELGL